MIRAATYSASGMYAGQLRILRHVEGDQRWRVVVKIGRGDQCDEHMIRSTGRVPLAAMRETVIASIEEMLPPGVGVSEASMDFYIDPAR